MTTTILSRSLLAAAIAFVAATASAETPSGGGGGGRRPNVVLIISDDLGYNDLGFQGSLDILTPHLDDLARRGTRFTNAYVTAPICGPTRAGLISGRYQQKHSYDGNPRRDQGLNLKETTLAQALKAGGYATCAIGKWHLGNLPEYRPPSRGFDEFFGFYGAMHSYTPGPVAPDAEMVFEGTRRPRPEGDGAPPRRPGGLDAAAKGPANPPAGALPGRLIRNDAEVVEPEYLTNAFARETVDFIGRQREQPFFLYLAFNASHSPLQPPAEYLARYPHLEGKRKAFAATTSAFDDAVGQVVTKVRELGLENDTVFYYTNDNGGPPQDIAASNAPLSGTKFSLWEGGIRVPSFVVWPGHVPAGQVFNAPVTSLDIYPTLLAATGVATPADKKLDGANLLPVLQGGELQTLVERPLFGGSTRPGLFVKGIGNSRCQSVARQCNCSICRPIRRRTTIRRPNIPRSSRASANSGRTGTKTICQSQVVRRDQWTLGQPSSG